MPGHYSGPPKPPAPNAPERKLPKAQQQKPRSGASKGALKIDINSGDTESRNPNAN